MLLFHFDMEGNKTRNRMKKKKNKNKISWLIIIIDKLICIIIIISLSGSNAYDKISPYSHSHLLGRSLALCMSVCLPPPLLLSVSLYYYHHHTRNAIHGFATEKKKQIGIAIKYFMHCACRDA